MLTTASTYFLYWKTAATNYFASIHLQKPKKPSIMKKKSIKKLTLCKASISTLQANAIAGGTGQSAYQFCESINICETRDYSACNGEFGCQLYLTINC